MHIHEVFGSIKNNKKFAVPIIVAVVLVIVIAVIYFFAFSAPERQAGLGQFLVNTNRTDSGEVVDNLVLKDFIKSPVAFKIVYLLHGSPDIQPGAYQISKSMSVWEIADILSQEPNMKWVTVPEGLRKEQIANILADKLHWSDEQTAKWVTTYTAMKFDYVEGVYFPDTYLIPVDEAPLAVAERMQRRFEEQFTPYSKEALEQNIQWTSVIKLASVIQREAAGSEDMPLIAGILWNRLNQKMKLEVDATIQYVRDSLAHYGTAPDLYQDKSYTAEGTWWKPILVADKQIDSLFNTYLYAGLPPRPISNPGLDAIQAVLHPEETDCLYYLHDNTRTIHCAKTLAEHEQNIEEYLR
ncbi:MAG: endolytic transglycosylase MltG [Patescibacteria group bacterium]